MKGFALRLVLKHRHKKTRKWPICLVLQNHTLPLGNSNPFCEGDGNVLELHNRKRQNKPNPFEFSREVSTAKWFRHRSHQTKSRASKQESAPTTERPVRFSMSGLLEKEMSPNFHRAFQGFQQTVNQLTQFQGLSYLYRRERISREGLESKSRRYNSFPLLRILRDTTARFYASIHINNCFRSNIFSG